MWEMLAANTVMSGINNIMANEAQKKQNKILRRAAKRLEDNARADLAVGNRSAYEMWLANSMINNGKIDPGTRQMYGQTMSANQRAFSNQMNQATRVRAGQQPTTSWWKAGLGGTAQGVSDAIPLLFLSQDWSRSAEKDEEEGA